MIRLRRTAAAVCAAVLGGALIVIGTGPATATPSAPLTNLAHLDFLTTSLTPPAQVGHTTYRLDTEPAIGALWVYTDRQADGSFVRVGGGTHDAGTDTYGQGAYDADDMARAAVVYLRHWQQFGDAHSRQQAYQLLRGVTYLQTASGPDAGNVVLWMQQDGTLNPSPTPPDSPDPSDSDASYWLARTIWALGAGYAQFRHTDPAFAAFLAQRMQLAVAALHREVLADYGTFQVVDGVRTPAWLIGDGADASSEAVLGLAAYVQAGGPGTARTALAELSRGIADLQAGSANQWPYGALLPSATTRSQWHAWGSQMASALAAAAGVLHDDALLAPAVTDTADFTAQLLTSTGPDNALSPAPVDGSQIAYGADARVQALYSVGAATHSAGLQDLAAIAAGWFFGQNPSGQAVYDPSTGVTDDGVSADGTVNLNSGAESTIHGLLTMLTLDAHPGLAQRALASAQVSARDGQRVVEAETGRLTGGATVVTAPAGSAESQFSGGEYVSMPTGGSVTWTLPASAQPRIIEPIVNRVVGPAGQITVAAAGRVLGSVPAGGAGAQGVSAVPGILLPQTLTRTLPAGATTITATSSGGTGELDALLVTPEVATLTLTGHGQATALVNSRASRLTRQAVAVSGSGPASVTSYDRSGRAISHAWATGSTLVVAMEPGGFTVITR